MSDFLADFVELAEFAKQLTRHPRTIQRWIDEPNGLPATRLGNRTMIHTPTAREWLLARVRSRNPQRRKGRAK
jgi:hypothetical protein